MWMGELITQRGVGNGIVADHLRQHHGTAPQRDLLLDRAQRQRRALHDPDRPGDPCGDRPDHLRRARPAPHPGLVRQTGHGASHDGRPEHLSAHQGEHGRGHPDHLRLLDLVHPAQLAVFFPNVGWIQGFSNSPVGGLAQLDPLGGSHRVFFAYFYTAMVFNPNDTADNLKRQGGFIPGIRPGTPTAQYIKNVLNCITLPGAIFIALVAVVPSILFFFTGNTLIPGVRRHLDPHHGGRCARHDEQGREPAQDARLRGFLQIGSRVGRASARTLTSGPAQSLAGLSSRKACP